MSANSVVVTLSIDCDDLLRLYSGSAREVVALAEGGRTVRFPANVLRSQVMHDGVHGRFRIDFTGSGKFCGISRLQSGDG